MIVKSYDIIGLCILCVNIELKKKEKVNESWELLRVIIFMLYYLIEYQFLIDAHRGKFPEERFMSTKSQV